jgi:Cu(I)/Ag(I) efflux system membrane fusion protein
VLLFASCAGEDKSAAENTAGNQPLAAGKNSAAFNQSFDKMLNAYFALRDGLVDYDTVKANAASRELAQHADNLAINEITNDSTGAVRETAKNFAGTVSGSAKGLVGETELEKKKREFQMISDAMYDLVRTVKYDQQKIYHQHCPMAFGEEDAYWISTSPEIINPYLGKQHPKYKSGMLHCGDITDSLDFSK